MPKTNLLFFSLVCFLFILSGCKEEQWECGSLGCYESANGSYLSEDACIQGCRGVNTTSLCSNDCNTAFDGECDDGGPGSLYNSCNYGTDCADCGRRSIGGGGTSNGDVTFWINTDYGCGNISVTVTGEGTEDITGFFTSGINFCNANNSANFTLPPGAYIYSASCTGYSWGPNNFTVTSGGCSLIQLTL